MATNLVHFLSKIRCHRFVWNWDSSENIIDYPLTFQSITHQKTHLMVLKHFQRSWPLFSLAFPVWQPNPVGRLEREFDHLTSIVRWNQLNIGLFVWIMHRRYDPTNDISNFVASIVVTCNFYRKIHFIYIFINEWWFKYTILLNFSFLMSVNIGTDCEWKEMFH